MEIAQYGDASALIGNRPYETWLQHPEELASICPPPLAQLDEVFSARRQYIEKHIDRSVLVAGLQSSHQRRGAPPSSLASIDLLLKPDSYLIVTGQQPGLLGGPLFTYYKILHAIVLAKRLSQQRRETFLPAFWDASEDHDFPEIATVKWISKEKEIASFTWPGDAGNRRPYYHIPIEECPIEELLTQIRETTHPTEFTALILDQIRECARGIQTYPDFFDRLMWLLFQNEGLIILRPDDPWMRKTAQPILEREMLDPQRSTAGVERVGEILQSQGLSPQIHKRADRTAFFLIENQERIALYTTQQGFIADSGQEFTRDELLARLAQHPEVFSPSAILRPLIQDALLPIATSILGPGEMAYHFLLHDIYEGHGVPRPCLIPRMGFSLIDGRETKLMDRYELQFADFLEHPAAIVKKITRKSTSSDWQDKQQAAIDSLETLFSLWKNQAQENDPSIVPMLDKNFDRIQKELSQSEALLVRKLGEKNQQIQKHIEALCHSMVPDGSLQERQYNIFTYLLKFGPDLLDRFRQFGESIPDGVHCLVKIP